MSGTTPRKDRRPVVISGPSGVGKGTLINKLCATYPDFFKTTVSHTTRQPRENEVEGQEYFFVSQPEFLALVSQNAFVEWAVFAGNHYGTSTATITDQAADGHVVILDIDVQGAKRVHADPNLDARYVFIKPPSLEALEARLRHRSTEDEHSLQRRLSRAALELDEADRCGVYDIFIVNDDLETAFHSLVEFIFGKDAQ